jgi:hypothetical protein
MKSIWFETRSVIVATGLLFGAAGIVRADAVSIQGPDAALANSDKSCGSDLSSCQDAIPDFSSPPSLHLPVAHHRVAKHRPVVVAAHQRPGPEVAFQQLTCAGSNAWSLLCPGAQIIGISY